MNKLYFGDNLQILRERVASESVDLIYLDPPFNSQSRYNVLFKSPRTEAVTAQVGAFLDFWSWETGEAERAYHELLAEIGGAAATIIQALRGALGESDMMAYLVMMATRLHELHRVLKPTGSLYLHCDSTASHYLKIILDGIFGSNQFKNEVIWQRTFSHGDSKTWSRVSDTILFYTKSEKFTWNPQHLSHSAGYIESHYNKRDEFGRPFQLTSILSPSSRPNMMYEWKGFPSPPLGWRFQRETMADLDARGLIWYPTREDGSYDFSKRPRFKRYLDDQKGPVVTNIWTDIAPVNARAKERIGYPTQKPLSLLTRIISASSNRGDVILDPFCGCGTSVHSSQAEGRRWVGIDISIHAIHVIEQRLASHFGPDVVPRAEGIPEDYDSAARLAQSNPFQFQWWANYLVGVHVLKEVKRGADRGIDGEMFFPNGPDRPYGRLLTSVKGGKNVSPAMIREFRGVLEREEAEMGLFICLDPPTSAMETEAVVAGFAPVVHGQFRRLQIVSVADWFSGRRPVLPPRGHLPYAAFSHPIRRQKGRRPDPNAPELPLSFVGGKEATSSCHFNPHLVEVA